MARGSGCSLKDTNKVTDGVTYRCQHPVQATKTSELAFEMIKNLITVPTRSLGRP